MIPTRAVHPIALMLTVLAIEAACGKPPEPSEAQAAKMSRPTACSLISQTEMASILGGALATPQAVEGLASTTCRYEPASEASPISSEVKIEWDAGESAMDAVRVAQRAAENVTNSSLADPLEGLGDEATMLGSGIVIVRRGKTLISIDVQLQPDARAKGSQIARKLLERMGPA
jgi:hypothetical protein